MSEFAALSKESFPQPFYAIPFSPSSLKLEHMEHTNTAPRQGACMHLKKKVHVYGSFKILFYFSPLLSCGRAVSFVHL